eukprot:TRINITY_DN3203_c0_g1_i1.p1 TRINITY_DN3203_c0_g1~~TRINITY_DN3203_c0_g1_i1.p1  ORF type:complete len:519 (+),score=78.61 TRINITY_DN3203_c0_g1_i1:83-1558(+)
MHEIEHKGKLKKLGGSLIQRYQTRHFELRQEEMRYWKTEGGKGEDALGVIRMVDVGSVTEEGEAGFRLRGKGLRHEYVLVAGGRAERDEWVECIRDAMAKAKERRMVIKSRLKIDEDSVLIRACTWNVAESKPSDHDRDEVASWLTGASTHTPPTWSTRDTTAPTIISVCLQEVDMTAKGLVTDAINTFVNPRSIMWTDFFSSLLPGYILVNSGHEASVLLGVWVRADQVPPNSDIVFWRGKVLKGLVEAGNKGAISIRFKLNDQHWLCFTGCHLPPHPEGFEKRNLAYHSIVEESDFGEYPSKIMDHDYAVWSGDLNYRMKGGGFEKGTAEEELMKALGQDVGKAVKMHDQLAEARAKNDRDGAFQVFHEAELKFYPTYKLREGRDPSATLTSQYLIKSESHHLPSYCDRVLYYSKKCKPTALLRLWNPPPLITRQLPTHPDRPRPLGKFPPHPPEVPSEMASVGMVCLDYHDTALHSDHRAVAALLQIV